MKYMKYLEMSDSHLLSSLGAKDLDLLNRHYEIAVALTQNHYYYESNAHLELCKKIMTKHVNSTTHTIN